MNLTASCTKLLTQLSAVVSQLTPLEFTTPLDSLSQATIGQHVRHTLEFFICLQRGFVDGVVNYDKRAHDNSLASDKELTLKRIAEISLFVQSLQEKPLKLEVSYTTEQPEFIQIDTTAMRELVYNMEHVVHHMAILKIGLREIPLSINLPTNFGVATSTLHYRNEQQTVNQA